MQRRAVISRHHGVRLAALQFGQISGLLIVVQSFGYHIPVGLRICRYRTLRNGQIVAVAFRFPGADLHLL